MQKQNPYKIKLCLTLLGFALYVAGLEAQLFSVSGYVTDQKSHETLIGASVMVKSYSIGTLTNTQGFFSLSAIKPGSYTLVISYLGYKTEERSFVLTDKGIVLEAIALEPTPVMIDEVSITSLQPNPLIEKDIETGQKIMTPQMIQSIPTARNDVFAAVKYLPGVDRTEPFSPLYTTRGGDPGENAVLLDGVLIYNPYHASVSAGIFNTQTIKNVELLLGGFSAEYGGRNASVMNITTKDGNPNEFHGEIEPSTFHSKFFLEFPAGKNSSMMLAGRYMYDVPYNFLFQNTTYFYDYNISYTNRLNNRHRLTFKYFESKDFTGYNLNTLYKYIGNTLGTDLYDGFILEQRNDLKNRAFTSIHRFILSPGVYIQNQLYYSSHHSNNFSGLDFEGYETNQNGDSLLVEWKSNNRLTSEIHDLAAKTAVEIKLASYHEIKAGVEYNNYFFENSIDFNQVNRGAFSRHPALWALFLEDKISTAFLIIRPGVRLTKYRQNLWNIEPRLNMVVSLPWKMKLKAAYGQYLQYIVSMNTNEIEISQMVDYYYPLWDRPPAKSVHYMLGLQKAITNNLSLSADVYYKEIETSYTFDLNQQISEAFGFSNRLQEGHGDAYGIEFFMNGSHGKISGWMSYSLAWANRCYPLSDIKQGESYPYDYTRRHTFKTVLNYQLSKKSSVNAAFQFLSGIPRSIETTTQNYFSYNPSTDELGAFPLYSSSEKNSVMMPPLLNLDFSMRRKLSSGIGQQFASFLKADESYVTVTLSNVLFLYRNVEFYVPGTFVSRYYDKYIPLGSNYIPRIGLSYTLRF